MILGRVAQLVERSSYTRMAGGPNPSTPTSPRFPARKSYALGVAGGES